MATRRSAGPPAGKAELVVQRGDWPGTAYPVLLDGKQVGRIARGASLKLVVEPGRHQLMVPSHSVIHGDSPPQTFVARAGHRYSCRCNPGTLGKPIDLADLAALIRSSTKRTPSAEPSKSTLPGATSTRAQTGIRPPSRSTAASPRRTRPVRRTPGGATPPPRTPEITRTKVVESRRRETSLGTDTVDIDNSGSDATITRKVQVSKQWSGSCTTETTKTVGADGSASVQAWLVNARATAEARLTKRYMITSGVVQTYIDELTVQVPPRSRTRLQIKWKQISQCGVVQCLDRAGSVVAEFPYRVVVGVTFDQKTS